MMQLENPDDMPLEAIPEMDVDLNVDLTESSLSWEDVTVTMPGDQPWVVKKRLLLVENTTRVAYDIGVGTTLRCNMLQLQGQTYALIDGAQIEVRRVVKPRRVANNRFEGLGCIYTPGTPEQVRDWVQIATANETVFDYYTPGTQPMRGTIVNVSNVKVLQLQEPYANLAILLENDVTMQRGTTGFLLKSALLGEVRLAYRMEPILNGPYQLNTSPENTVAIKVMKHFHNAVPNGTRELNRALYDREDAIKEVELTAYVNNAPNPMYPPRYRGHPNLMNLLEVLADHNNVYMVIEFMNSGDLFEAIFETHIGAHYFHEANSRDCMRQILSGVRFLHNIGVSHLDISAENIFVHRRQDGTYRFVLADFGQSELHRRHMAAEAHVGIHRFMPLPPYRAQSAPGKKMYYVPETFLSRVPLPFNGFKVDSWQLGILHIVIFCRSVPFNPERGTERLVAWLQGVQRGQLRYLVVHAPIDPNAPAGGGGTVRFGDGYPIIYEIANQMLQYNPAIRQVIYDDHPYYIG